MKTISLEGQALTVASVLGQHLPYPLLYGLQSRARTPTSQAHHNYEHWTLAGGTEGCFTLAHG